MFSKFKTQEEAIKRANGTQYGLGAAIFTQNIARAHKVNRCITGSHTNSNNPQVAAKIDSGMVWINRLNKLHLG